MSETKWQLLTTAPNIPAAHALETLLKGRGIECRLKSDTALLGEGRECAVMVEVSLLHRAKYVLAEVNFTDEELDFLATGQLSCDAAKERP